MSQIKTSFVEDNAITGSKIRLNNQEMLRGRNAANTNDVNILNVNGDDAPEFQTLPRVASSLPLPTDPKQLATLEYIATVIEGKGDQKDAVAYLADGNVALTGSTPLTIDDGTITNGMRVGLTGQTDASENGIYVMAITGGTYALTRSADANNSERVTNGMWFVVTAGTVYALWEAILTTPDPITLDTTDLDFVLSPTVEAVNAGDGLQKVGNKFTADISPVGGLRSTNPGNDAGQLAAQTDTAALQKDKTTWVDSTNAIVALKPKRETFTLQAQDITNQYIDLANIAGTDSITFNVVGAPPQFEGIDYTVNYTGGTGSKTRITFAGGLASAGVSALSVGDIIHVIYSYLKA